MATALAVAGSGPQQQVSLGPIPERLDSWKEIAVFFARTIRTVQRWERTENLPVYRHVHKELSSVYAFDSELLAWQDARSRQSECSLRKKASTRRLRLAVLPFANLSTDPQVRHFEDGLTHEIIAQFARLDPARLGVIARTSVMPYKNSGCNIAQIARTLHVDYILEGSVRLSARQIRIAAQLIDVRDQTHILADTCARRWTEGVSIQVAFAERIARLVCEHLLVASPAAL
jgi:TolB-like protein